LEVAPRLLGQKIVPPHLVVLDLDGEKVKMDVIFVETTEQWNEKAARRDFIGALGERFAKQMRKPIAICLFSEGLAKAPPTKEDTRPWSTYIKDSTGRIEIISCIALTIDWRTGAAFAEILRDAEARISGYGEIESIACGSRQENGEPAAEAGILEPFFHGYLQARFGPGGVTPTHPPPLGAGEEIDA
jgi:hypothetical protein